MAFSVYAGIALCRKIQRDIFFHETMPIMFPGARYDYRHAVELELEEMAKNHKGPPLRPIAET